MEHALTAVTDLVCVTCEGTGAPPLPVLARVTHVLSGTTATEVWTALREALPGVPADDLVLLRAGRGAEETWIELRVLPR